MKNIKLILASLVLGGTLANGCKPMIDEDEHSVTTRKGWRKTPHIPGKAVHPLGWSPK